MAVARDGRAALAACAEGRFDAVPCDVRMDGMAAPRDAGDAPSPGIAGRIAGAGCP